MTSKPVAEMDIEPWLKKVVQWNNKTSLENQQDVCLHLPKLHEFLLEMYETLKHMEPSTSIQKFPALGQFLGRLCWNPFVVGHEDTQKMLICCLCCLTSSEPQSAIDRKANSWVKSLFCHLLSSSENERKDIHIFLQLECTPDDYYEKLLKNIISTLIKRLRSQQDNQILSAEHVRSICVACIPFLTLAEVIPLLEALLLYHGPEPYEVLDNHFLDAVNDAFQKRAILESEGNFKVITIVQLFTLRFIHEYEKDTTMVRLPLKAYFSHEDTHLVLALLRKADGLASNICVQHLQTIVKMLRTVDSEERSFENVFQSWFLLIRLGGWVDIAAEQLLTSDPEISDDLLWLLAFYYNPCNGSQSRGRTMVEAKAVYEQLVSLRRSSSICANSVYKLFAGENTWHPCTRQLIRYLCVTFIVLCPEWHSVAQDCVSHMTQTQEAASEISDVLARTLSRLDIPGMGSQKIVTIVHTLLQDL
ncbi:Fanconi anemia group C protein isoform X3 [Engystomops pustulosus]|uniref:Fanconi anemia group C protein isoform X3 n=1 Tax=Engystomops pustulosus TaxID=76066 RepID=UPI003AFA7830